MKDNGFKMAKERSRRYHTQTITDADYVNDIALLINTYAQVVSILLYGCTTWTLTKRIEKKLDDNYTIMLRAILNKSWKLHPKRQQLCGHLQLITKTI